MKTSELIFVILLSISVNSFSQEIQKASDVNLQDVKGSTEAEYFGFSNPAAPPAQELTSDSKKERLNTNVNSKYLESKPVISPDGLKLYFARKNCPSNIGGKRDEQDIYVSEFIRNEWSPAYNIDRPLNDNLPNGICSVSPDGNTIMVINAYHEDGSVEDGVSISRKTAFGWSKPKKQEIRDYYNLSYYQDYFQSNSGKVLLSAVQRDDSKGELDLYISFRTGEDSWSVPINLGSVINTEKAEFAPFLASDNKTLYFASNGHFGFGESDIFFSRRLDDSWTKWTYPQNVGESINSMNWDGYYTISAKGDYAYFISTGGILNKLDFNPTDEDIYQISLSKEVKPTPVVLIKGKVINSKTKEPIEADIYYESLSHKNEEGLAISDPLSGNYKIVLPTGKKYGFRAEANGYITISQNEDFTEVNEYKEITRNLMLTPLKVGEIAPLNNIFFVQSKAEMLPESRPELNRLLLFLNDNPALQIELRGHTDNQGSSSANFKLSESRAAVIADFLLENGINKKRLKTKGYGASRPIASNANAESRKKNRRVEIKILKF